MKLSQTTRIVGLMTLIAIVPFGVLAAEFRSGEDRLSIQQTVNDDLYAAAGQVTIDSNVTGDVFATGGTVRVAAPVAEDLFAAGGNLQIDENVGGDVRVAGGQVTISGTVGGDVIAAGGSVELLPGSSVAGEVVVSGGQIVLAGRSGSVQAATESLRVENSARIEGDLTYTSSSEAEISAEATITGTTKREDPPKAPRPGGAAGIVTGSAVIWLLVSVIMTMLFAYVLPNKTAKLVGDWKKNFGMNLVWGLVFMIVVPVLSLILLVSVIGIPLAFLSLVTYGVLMYLAKLVTALAVGSWIQSQWVKGNGLTPPWAAAVIGVVVVALVSIIPVLGWLAVFIAYLASLGALVQFDWTLLKKLRGDKVI